MNPGVRALLIELLPFVRERIDAHRDRGDLDAWGDGFGARFEETIGSALVASLIGTVDSGLGEAETQRSLSSFLDYLLAEPALPGLLLTTADGMQLLDDEQTMLPLARALSEAVVVNAREAVSRGTALSLEPSVVSTGTDVAREAFAVDEANVAARLIGGLVEAPLTADGETPLEVILDVIVELNRAEPGASVDLNEADYRAVMGAVQEFMRDDIRGLERLYDVIQHREVAP
jgi:hypothetical protein